MPDREDMKSILEACRRTGPMDESLVRGTVESSSSNSEEYHADAMRGTNYLQFSCDENGNDDQNIVKTADGVAADVNSLVSIYVGTDT